MNIGRAAYNYWNRPMSPKPPTDPMVEDGYQVVLLSVSSRDSLFRATHWRRAVADLAEAGVSICATFNINSGIDIHLQTKKVNPADLVRGILESHGVMMLRPPSLLG